MRVPSSLLHRRKKPPKEKGKKKKKKGKGKFDKEKKEEQVGVEDSDEEERSLIELTKPEPKNVKVEGVLPNLPDKPQVLNEFVSQQTEENIAIMRKQAKMKRKRRKKRRRKTQAAFEELNEEERARENQIREQLLKLDPTKAATKQDSSFYPAPKNLEKRRCYIHKNARALKCTVCDGGEYLYLYLGTTVKIPVCELVSLSRRL